MNGNTTQPMFGERAKGDNGRMKKQRFGCRGCGSIWEIDIDKAKIGAELLQCPLCYYEEEILVNEGK